MVKPLPDGFKLSLYHGGTDPVAVGLLNTHLILGYLIEYNSFDEDSSDSDKLRLVAHWLDAVDKLIEQRVREAGREFDAGDSIQKDLLRIANNLEREK